MKKCLSASFILLTVFVVGAVMLNDDVHEKVNESCPAVIVCPYAAGYEKYPKYFCKGIYTHCETVIESDGQNPWTLKGRLSLHDITEIKKFAVTFSNLTLGDAGRYGCGVKVSGRDPFTVVHLTVMKAQKQHSPTSSTAGSTFTTEGKPMSAVTTRSPGSATDSTGSSTQLTVSQSLSGRRAERPTSPTKSLSGIITYAGGAFGAVVLVMSVIFCVFKYRTMKGNGGTNCPNSALNMKDVCIYEEIQHSNPVEDNASETTDILSSPNSYLVCKTIYTPVTNQKQEPHLGDTLLTNHVSCSTRLDSDPNESLVGPIYCHVVFPNTGYNNTYSTVQAVYEQSPIYSVIIAPTTDTNSDDTNDVPPKQDTHEDETST